MSEDTYPPGTIRGPFQSSPGNPWQWQACLRLDTGLVYEWGKTKEEVMTNIQKTKEFYRGKRF